MQCLLLFILSAIPYPILVTISRFHVLFLTFFLCALKNYRPKMSLFCFFFLLKKMSNPLLSGYFKLRNFLYKRRNYRKIVIFQVHKRGFTAREVNFNHRIYLSIGFKIFENGRKERATERTRLKTYVFKLLQ